MRARARVRNPFLDLHACLPPANRLVLQFDRCAINLRITTLAYSRKNFTVNAL